MEPQMNWTQEETRALLGVWSEEKIQKDLKESFRNENVYREVSGRLATMGMNRSAKQCREKIKKLKQEYRRTTQHSDRSGAVRRSFRWYDAMDTIMNDKPAATDESAAMMLEFMISDVETDSPSMTDFPESCTTPGHVLPFTVPGPTPGPMENPQVPDFYSVQLEDCDGPSRSSAVTSTEVQTLVKDTTLCCWSNTEVQALLTFWASPKVQKELLLNVRNNRVYTYLSAKLTSLGFNKAPKKCREKIKKLKQEYKRIKNGHHMGGSSSVWFSIMDEVLSSQTAAVKHSETADSSSTESSLPTQSVPVDVNTDDESQWLPDEIQVLMTLWSQPNIQKRLLTSTDKNEVFTYLSSELALVGFTKTPHQCSLKVNNLKEEYKRIKQLGLFGDVKSDWFTILDGVLCPDGEKWKEMDSSMVLTEAKSPEDKCVNDTKQDVWTSDEVKVLLTRWAEESVQEQLRSTKRNERVFAQLSSELATHGFDKTTSQCRSKIHLLKQRYKRIKEQKDSKKQQSRWFSIMDKVLGSRKSKVVAAEGTGLDRPSLQASQPHIPETAEGCHLSISSLCLLVPHLRLMSAFAWQVVQCRNVAHYGKVEELVRLVTELVPELLTPREKVQLLLRLRARLVLELCLSESTANLLNIQPHLKVIEDLTISCCSDQEELEELEKSKSNFVEVVHTLLEDMDERKIFFKEVFPIHYGQQYEVTLNTLVWKFISRLDNLLPIPDIKQTAEWLSTSPSIMEECERLVLEPHQLKVLLDFHQQQSENTNQSFSQAQNMFLPALSLQSKANWKQLASEQQEMLTDDERQFDYSEDEEPVEENQSNNEPTVEEDLTLKDEQRDGMTTANAPNLNHAPLHLQSCSLCPYSDNKASELLNHIRKEHLIQEAIDLFSIEPGEDVLQKVNTETLRSATNTCEYCGKVFEDVTSLNTHIKTHIPPFHCDKCDKKYSSKDALTVHQRIHTGELPYLCSHCGRGFRSLSGLELHVRTHTGDRRYKCHICGKTSIQHLARHMRMHRGEKNYLCTECGKTFLSSGELRLHIRSHTGERPYTCKHCGKGFITKCHLMIHIRRHTGESPYRCSLCPKSFCTLRAQKRHTMIHSDKKSFQCLKCGKIFRHEETFKMHTETHK
ncbi:uncharacterized protein LOC110967438 isoform X5 [Acanthochromis polyacanthus]|uniref:uncharacterized protein LOC110967438 isoform X5 n=1 Tax=Acanthochromis polyacanthus TaxID=80966 RepID=UPI0022346621|nr:uncharacterized protein LOC110967438 isoform X5 [Acanthochromis polyacanthus]